MQIRARQIMLGIIVYMQVGKCNFNKYNFTITYLSFWCKIDLNLNDTLINMIDYILIMNNNNAIIMFIEILIIFSKL